MVLGWTLFSVDLVRNRSISVISVDAHLMCQNHPPKSKMAGNILECVQVKYSILKHVSVNVGCSSLFKARENEENVPRTSWALLGIISDSRPAVEVTLYEPVVTNRVQQRYRRIQVSVGRYMVGIRLPSKSPD